GETDLEGGAGQGQPDAQANMTVDFGFYTIQMGNLVWDDANVQDNGLYDTGTENGIQFVDVQLWSQDLSTLIATSTTDASGIYSFSGLPQGNYVARIPAVEFNPAGTLRDYVSSTGGAGTPFEPAPSAENNTNDSDDNGSITGGTLGLGGSIQSSVFALTPAAEESVNDALGLTTETRVDFGVFFLSQTDLAVTKDDGTLFYVPGGTLTYIITVTNNGPSDVPNATVSDVLPPQISSWTWDCTGASGGASGCTGVTDLTSDFSDILNLPQGGGITYTVTATIAGTASGDLTNSVTVASPGIIELDSTNNTADDVDQPASLQVTKDDGLLIVGAGSTVTYQIVVTNNGAIDMTSINVTDTLPADLTYQSANPAPTTIAGQVLTWTGLSLTSGASTTIQLTAQVAVSPSGTPITNVVAVLDTSTGANDSDDDTDTVALDSDFSKTLAGTDAAHTTDLDVAIGEILTYQLTINIPPGAMDNMLIVDTPQAGLAFVDLLAVDASNPDTDGAGAGDTGLYSTAMTFDSTGLCTNCADGTAAGTSNPLVENSGGKVTFNFGTLANSSGVNETVTIQYRVVVLDMVANQNGGTLVNNAVWTWSGGILTSSAPTVEIVEPDLSIDKNVNTNAAPYGSAVTFTIDIAHTADSAAHAYDVVVTDELPDGLAYIPGTLSFSGLAPTSNNYDAGTATLTFTWDEFPLSATATITFQATFIGPAPVVNTASVAWTSLPLDPTPGGPVVLSAYNNMSTERWYDPTDGGSLNNYGTQDSVTLTVPLLPNTGFAPGEITILPAQPDMLQYVNLGDFWLEIPELGVKMPIVGVPLQDVGWNLTWLGNQAGWLEGTAYPTHAGNSAITGHVNDANGNPGPFANLNRLYWGHKIIVHMGGQKYTYEVREVRLLWPNDSKVFKHEDLAWLTLITCKDYNEKTDTYAQRVAVRAVLVSVVDE
ncbi:MAG: sortase, partial [Chloroflexi bacterium]|nr:sortase [Chloroflexota bacterium]